MSAYHKVMKLALNLHHDLPCIDGQVSIVETPIELLLSYRLICRVMVGREIVVSKSLSGGYALLGVKDKHTLEKINSCVYC